ncbi:MAG: proline--tRNA ligase, partial [Bacteriovoracaceae bacterium]|nr:proline--tRNA ligase [Bacteriovoracaceae bacterium]
MKKSRFFWQTYKETPSDAETISHQLLLRAGLIFKEGQGLYAFLPMGLRVLKKIEQITREEMNKAHCQELQVPVVTPSELWKETGRFESMKDLMLKAQDRGEREVCISPTNEEAVVDIFRKTVNSYRDLPLNLYQINTKFRDEIRPRFGLMRAREFLMKDGYSFHLSKECLDKEYQNMFSAYSAVFKRAGLEFIAVEADGGAIAGGGARTHEFQVIADSGEDFIVQCTGCGYAANVERAETKRTELAFKKNQEDLKKVETKNMPTIVAVSEFLGLPQYQCLKALIYTALWGNKEKHF